MRPFSISKPTWWTGPTGQAITQIALDSKDEADYTKALELRILGTWLQNSSLHNQYGLYHAPEAFVVAETGLRGGARMAGLWKALHLLEFCTFDRRAGWVWVYEMARHQLNLPLKGQDNQIKAANHWYRSMPDNPFLGPFYDRYRLDLRLDVGRREGRASQAPSKGLVPDHDLVQVPVQEAEQPRGKHRGHVVCGERLCLPTFLFDEFKGQLGAAWRAGQVEAWFRALDLSYATDGTTITDDPLTVLRREFRGALKSLKAAQVNGSGPGWRDRCPHGGSCGLPIQCAQKTAQEQGTTFSEALERLEAS